MNLVVYDPAKVAKMKAIHNSDIKQHYYAFVVYDPAKVAKMKAIHNNTLDFIFLYELFMTLQR